MCRINLEGVAAIPFSINLLTGGDVQIKKKEANTMLLSQSVSPETKGDGVLYSRNTLMGSTSLQALQRTPIRQAAQALMEMIEITPPLPPSHGCPCPSMKRSSGEERAEDHSVPMSVGKQRQ